ncbi:hypothetical protein BBP40_008120 [Aspergillus hancockii]|nr:hypothetical protein BBP40_008120 [Aspergillus hancockii]
MARAAVIPAASPQRTTRTAKRTTTTASRSANAGATKSDAKTTKAKAPTSATDSRKRAARTNLSALSRPADGDTDEDTDDELGLIDTKGKSLTAAPKGRPAGSTTTSAGRGRKPAAATSTNVGSDGKNGDDHTHRDGQKKRAGRPRTKPATETAPKQRGRPKGSTNAKPSTSIATTRVNAQKKAHARDGIDASSQEGLKEMAITTNSTIMRSNFLRGPAKKKTVTFKDVSDSDDLGEPSPPPPAGRRRAATTIERQAGLGAKPARKASTTAGRGRKPAATKKGAAKPLSPKKATQVAKGISSYASSDGEDDELSGAKDQNKLHIDSPSKHGSETAGLSSPVKRINFTSNQPPKTVDENGEPTLQPPKSIDFTDTAFMSSPARRPPPSPFNYTIRETPRRGRFALHDDANTNPQPNFTPTKDSPLKSSPRKANLETPRRGNLGFHDDMRPLSQPDFTHVQNSPLKSSPKKGLFGASFFSQPSVQESSTPLKQSLLQSPAKRVGTPFKSSLLPQRSPVIERLQDEESEANLTPKSAMSLFQRYDSEETIEMADESEQVNEITADRFDAQRPEPETRPELETEPEIEEPKGGSNTPQYEIGEQTPDQPLDYLEDNHKEVTEDIGIDPAGTMSEHEEAEDINNDPEEPMEDVRMEREDTIEIDEPATYFYELFEGQNDIINSILMEDEQNTEQEYAANNLQGHTESIGVEEQDDHTSVQDAQSDYLEEELEQMAAEVGVSVAPDAESIDDFEEQQSEDLQEAANFPGREIMVEGLEDVFTEHRDPASEMGNNGSGPEPEPRADTSEDVGGHSVDSGYDYDEEELDMLDDYEFNDGEDTLVVFDTPRQTPRRTPHRTPRQTPGRTSRQTRPSTPPVITPYEIEEPPTPYVPSRFPSFAPPRFPDEYRDNVEETMSFSATDTTTEARIPAQDVQPSPQPQRHTPASETERRNRPRFTILAEQLSQWKATSPGKVDRRHPGRRGVFSLSGKLSGPSNISSVPDVSYPDISAQPQSPTTNEPESHNDVENIEDINDQEEPEVARTGIEELEKSPGLPMFEIFSDLSPEENEQAETNEATQVFDKYESPERPAVTIQETFSDDEKENFDVQLPAPVTPVRRKNNPLQTFHTVSKVPLKPEGEESPLKISRKRGRSLSIPSPTRSSPRSRKFILAPQEELSDSRPRKAPRLSYSTMPQLQPSRSRSISRARDTTREDEHSMAPSRSPSPVRAPRRRSSIYQAAPTGALQGAVVYVDVHTTEGEDASGIFVELLQQMGARCVKNWSWNPRASVSPDEQIDSREGKVGITHVVYKDGGVRTLEKVRQAAGVVKCVGVGWVLDCERENKWLDEVDYTVDSSIIPRGGAKRRKSMEPRALSNVNGTLVKADTTSTGSRRSAVGAADGFTRTTTYTPRDAPSTPKRSSNKYGADQKYFQTPKTPGYIIDMDAIGMSPATPGFLQRSRLVQQTCPPKQLRQGLFSTSDPSGEQSQKLRAKLEAARRKSLAFKPKIGSRLAD